MFPRPIDAAAVLPFVHLAMQIDRDALREEWKPKVIQWATTKVQRMKRDAGALIDANAIEGAALNALERAIASWPGVGKFEGYLRAALKNAWLDDARRERRHRHATYPTVKDDGRDPDSSEGGADLGLDLESINGNELPVFRIRRKRFRGGDSVVVAAAMRREQAADFLKGGIFEVMRKMGASPEEIRDAIREKNRRVYRSDYRHPERAALRFNALFKDGQQVPA